MLGVPIPSELLPRNFDPKKLAKSIDFDPKKLAKNIDFDPKKLAKSIDVKDLAKQIGNAAEQIEARSEDVRLLSAQAKRLSRKLA